MVASETLLGIILDAKTTIHRAADVLTRRLTASVPGIDFTDVTSPVAQALFDVIPPAARPVPMGKSAAKALITKRSAQLAALGATSGAFDMSGAPTIPLDEFRIRILSKQGSCAFFSGMLTRAQVDTNWILDILLVQYKVLIPMTELLLPAAEAVSTDVPLECLRLWCLMRHRLEITDLSVVPGLPDRLVELLTQYVDSVSTTGGSLYDALLLGVTLLDELCQRPEGNGAAAFSRANAAQLINRLLASNVVMKHPNSVSVVMGCLQSLAVEPYNIVLIGTEGSMRALLSLLSQPDVPLDCKTVAAFTLFKISVHERLASTLLRLEPTVSLCTALSEGVSKDCWHLVFFLLRILASVSEYRARSIAGSYVGVDALMLVESACAGEGITLPAPSARRRPWSTLTREEVRKGCAAAVAVIQKAVRAVPRVLEDGEPGY